MARLHSILVPVDGSSPSLAALDHAMSLANDYDAHILVLHVYEPHDSLSPMTRFHAERETEIAVDRARRVMGPRIHLRSVAGDPTRAIVEAAWEDINLIVMGTHGHIGRLHSLVGSVTESVVRNAPCPVLTVREAGTGYQTFAERRHGRPSLSDQPRR